MRYRLDPLSPSGLSPEQKTPQQNGYVSQAQYLNSLSDVNVSGTPSDNQALAYDTASGQWIPQTISGGGGASQLSDLTDVNTSTPTNRNVLIADGVDFESRALTEADISDLGSYLSNVSEDTTPQLGGDLDANGNSLSFNSETKVKVDSVNIQDGFLVLNGTTNALERGIATTGALTLYPNTGVNGAGTWEPFMTMKSTGEIQYYNRNNGTKQVEYFMDAIVLVPATGFNTTISTSTSATGNTTITMPSSSGTLALQSETPTISSGAGAPASTPTKVGDVYIDTTADDAYIAVGTASSADWEKSNDGAGVSDGDKGDITVSGSGTTWTIDNGVVTYAKLQDVSATDRILGRVTAGAGDAEELTATQVRTLINVADGATANSSDATLLARANHTGTQTASTISDFDTEVSNNTDVAANTAARHAAVTVTDSSEIDFTLTGQNITASIVAGSIDETKLDTSTNASLDLADSSVQPGDNISTLTNDAGYTTNTGDVTAASSFATDNIMVRADGTGKGLQAAVEAVMTDTGRVLLGDTESVDSASSARLKLADADGALSDFAMTAYGGGYGTVVLSGSGGTPSSPTASGTSDRVGSIKFQSYNGSTFVEEARINGYEDGDLDLTATSVKANGVPVVTTTDSQTLTNKTISGSSNTLSNIGTSAISDDAVTAAKMQYGVVRNRQGGTSGDNNWYSSGTTNTDTSAKAVFTQVGRIATSSGADTVVTFPTAYNYTPIVVACTSQASGANGFCVVTSTSTTQFSCRVINDSGTRIGESVNWVAFGQ